MTKVLKDIVHPNLANVQVGDRLRLNSGAAYMVAKPGATAIVGPKGIFKGYGDYVYIDIVWERDHLSAGQMDGGYEPDFRWDPIVEADECDSDYNEEEATVYLVQPFDYDPEFDAEDYPLTYTTYEEAFAVAKDEARIEKGERVFGVFKQVAEVYYTDNGSLSAEFFN